MRYWGRDQWDRRTYHSLQELGHYQAYALTTCSLSLREKEIYAARREHRARNSRIAMITGIPWRDDWETGKMRVAWWW